MTDADADGGFARVTAAGCYTATRSPAGVEAVDTLIELLSSAQAMPWRPARHGPLADTGLVERIVDVESVDTDNLETFLPRVLGTLSDRGRAVLSESRQGLFLDSAGLSREHAERLAVIGSALYVALHRDPLLADGRLGVAGSAVGIVDPSGHADVGFWPLHVGRYVFMLAVFGIPRFDRDGFRRLVWLLQQRYGHAAALPT